MTKYYICRTCGNLIEKVEDGGTDPSCCSKTMTPLEPGTTDGALEFHVPIISIQKCTDDICKVVVSVGAEPHPMTSTHFIKWIELHTTKGVYRKCLKPECKPEATFYICCSESVTDAFAYCNIHALWKGV